MPEGWSNQTEALVAKAMLAELHRQDANDDELSVGWYVARAALAALADAGLLRVPHVEPVPAKCPHCDPTHGTPFRTAWGVFVGPERDADGQPIYLYVQPTAGAHVAQEDADWLYALMRDAQPNTGPRVWAMPEEPPTDVAKVTDRSGITWTRRRDDTWVSPGTAGWYWREVLRDFGPLTEVLPNGD